MKFGPGALCALAALCIAGALQLNNGAYDPLALALVTAAGACLLAAALWLRFGAPARENPMAARVLLGIGCTGGLVLYGLVNPVAYADPRAFDGGFRWFVALSLIVLSAYLCIHLRASLIRARFLLLLLCFAVLAIVVLRASPRPWIDVWSTRQGAAAALQAGHDPYSVGYPNIYGSMARQFYAPELLRGNLIIAYGYPPVSALFDLPFFALFGDVRVLSLVAMLVGAWALGRALPGVTGELAALFVLFQPRTLFVLEQGWTDPLLLAAFAVSLLLARKPAKRVPHWLALGLALGVLAGSKQYSVLLLLPLWLSIPVGLRWRAAVTGAVLVLAATLPFVFWDPQGFYRGVVWMHLVQPFRADALSLAALYSRSFGVPGFAAPLGFAVAAVILALTLRWRLTAAQALSAAGAAWLWFMLLNKQAFCNYYWLGAGVAGAAAAARFAEEKA